MARPDCSSSKESRDNTFYGLAPPVAALLDWLVRREPSIASFNLTEIVLRGRRRFEMPRARAGVRLHAFDGILDEGENPRG